MSKILYIGDIPKNWNMKRLKYFVNIKTGKKDAGEGSIDGKYPFYTCSIEPKYIDSYSYDTEALLIAGNGCVGNTQYYKGKFDAYQRTYILDNFREIDPLFVKYYCFGLLMKSLEHSKIGSVIDFIKLGDIQNFIIAYPDIQGQKNIVSFLDKKLSIIDGQIEKNKKSIELLGEYRASLIDKVVSPKNHWKKEKLKYSFGFSKGLSITKDDLVEDGVKVISYGQIHSKENTGTKIIDSLIRYVPNKYLDSKTCLVKKDDFIFADTSEDLDGVGNCVYVDKEDTIFAGYHTIILKSKGTNTRFYSYLFKSNSWRSQLRARVFGIKLFSITQNILKQVEIVIPPKEEQQQIADYLDKKCSLIDKVIEYRKQIIEKLEEYKKSLIYEVVTGKIEV